MSQTAEVVICGAGIAGISLAHQLARVHGMRRVVLIDERPPLTLTSDKSSEAYRNWWPGPDDAMIRLMNRSIDLLEELAAASGNRFLMNRRGYLWCTADPIRAEDYREHGLKAAAEGAGELRIHTGRMSDPDYRPHRADGWKDQPEGAAPMNQEAIQIVENLLDCPKPTISAVNGYAMGLGANFALLCDIVFASTSAVFADTHVRMGIGAGDGGQVIWPLLMGVNRAKYYLMTGDHLAAQEAERLGLVNFVVEPSDLLPKALELADRLAKGPGRAIAASKVPLNRWIKTQVQQIMPLSLEMEDACFRTEDAAEAGRAFVEKREPVFVGQ